MSFKIGRNERCLCESEKKYKNCCLRRDEILTSARFKNILRSTIQQCDHAMVQLLEDGYAPMQPTEQDIQNYRQTLIPVYQAGRLPLDLLYYGNTWTNYMIHLFAKRIQEPNAQQVEDSLAQGFRDAIVNLGPQDEVQAPELVETTEVEAQTL